MLGLTVFIVSTLVLNAHGEEKTQNDNKIKWTIKIYPIVFGKDATLFCNISSTHCCTNPVTWMKDSDVILHRGASINSSKYQQIEEKDGFSLIIKHFDETDINCQYTCLYGFQTYSSMLRINPNDFELLPSNETTNYKIDASQLVVDLNFGKVFPSPQCEIMMNERILRSKIVANETSNGFFLSSHIKLICELQSDICSGNTSVQCLVGKTRVINTPILPACKNGDATLTTIGNGITEVVFVIPVFLAVCFSIALPVIIYRRKRHLIHNCCDDLQGDEMYNLLPVQKGPECLLEIINEFVNNQYWLPFQRSKDVIKWLQVVVYDGLYLQLAATNLRINQIRNKIWTVIEEYASDMCTSIQKKSLYSRKSSDIESIRHTITTDDKNMLLTACNMKINEARMKRNDGASCCIRKTVHSKKERDILQLIDFGRIGNIKSLLISATNKRIDHARHLLWEAKNQLDSSLPVDPNNRTNMYIDVLQKMTENRMETADNNVKETSYGASCCIRKTLYSKKERDILQLIKFTPIGDVKRMFVTASNSRIDHARLLLWKEKNRLDRLVSIESMYNRINVDVLQKMTGKHIYTTGNSMKEKSNSSYGRKKFHSKREREILLQVNYVPIGDVTKMLVTASNSRINNARHLLWKNRDRLDSKYDNVQVCMSVQQSPTGNNGPSISRFNRIKHDRDLIIAIATFKKTNSSYCLMMASNIRINKARWKSSKAEKRIQYQ